MKALRRLVFILIASALVAAVPVSAIASEGILQGDVRTAEARFNAALTQAVRGGLDPARADQLTYRYAQVAATRPSAWWQAPAVEHNQLDKLGQLQSDLQSQYQQQVTQGKNALQQELARWNKAAAEAQKDGISSAGLDTDPTRFINYAALASSPNEYAELAKVVADEYTILDGRMADFRNARAQTDAALQNARTLLAVPGSTDSSTWRVSSHRSRQPSTICRRSMTPPRSIRSWGASERWPLGCRDCWMPAPRLTTS